MGNRSICPIETGVAGRTLVNITQQRDFQEEVRTQAAGVNTEDLIFGIGTTKSSVAEEVRDSIREGCIVFSLVSTLTIPRIKQLLGFQSIIETKMAALSQKVSDDAQDLGDITSNLPSLQFEHALTDDERNILNLRQRSHAHTVTSCAQATYFVSILNESRQIQKQLKNPTTRRATRLIQDTSVRDALQIGIIGCGRLGCHLAHCLLSFAEVNPSELIISTRRPETLVDLQQKKVLCMNNNAHVASRSHLLFLCLLPSQFPSVAEEVRDSIREGCIVYSLVSTLTIPRIKQLLGYNNIVRPEFTTPRLDEDVKWDCNVEVTAAFARRDMLEKTCPINLEKNTSVIRMEEKFAEQLIYAFVNVCTAGDLSRADTMDVLNAVVLGHTRSQPAGDAFTESDVTKYKGADSRLFPVFDLSTTINRDTPITKKLSHNQTLRRALVDRYCYVFQQYLDWRNTALAQARKQMHLAYD